jgi:RNA polymerase sigma factor (sigma-70 family)
MARDEARRAVREKRHLTLLTNEEADPAPAPDAAVVAELERERVRAALDRLTPRDREVLLLWDSGLSYDEIAAQTGLAAGAIGTTLARARKRLVEAYETGSEDEHVARG